MSPPIKSPPLLELIRKISPLITLYQKAGSDLRLVGGCVRDALLGKKPEDIDLATPLPPHEGMMLLKKEGIHCLTKGNSLSYGTFTVFFKDHVCDITTLRQDLSSDGRYATVAFSQDWQEDALRRDFTINALYADSCGEIHDFFQGRKDLKKGIIRFIGHPEERIREDYLRILRLFRFHAWYGHLPIDSTTLETCGHLASSLMTLSKERITYEFFKLLSAPSPLYSLERMAEYGLLDFLLKGYTLSLLKNLLKGEKILTLPPHPLRRLFVLTSDFSPFSLSKSQKQYLGKINTLLQDPFFKRGSFPFYLSLENKEWVRDALLVSYLQEQFVPIDQEMKRLMTLNTPPFPLCGEELKELGITGSLLGKTLLNCRRWWADQHFHPFREECLNWVKNQKKGGE